MLHTNLSEQLYAIIWHETKRTRGGNKVEFYSPIIWNRNSYNCTGQYRNLTIIWIHFFKLKT